MEILSDVPMPEECASRILEHSGRKVAPERAQDLWQNILQHKWVLSEKLGRGVSTNVSCLDFMENIESRDHTSQDSKKIQFLKEQGAMRIDQEIWETISETQPPKKSLTRE